MSQRTRNPFKLRATEKIESESTFLRIYSPTILEDFSEFHKDGKLWNDILFIRSSPGAGKSSLLRIFEPTTLINLFNSQSHNTLKDLRDYLKGIDVIDNNHIKLLGVSLQCNRNYEILEDLPIDDYKKKRFFFALINARLILASLRGILELNNLSNSATLENITIDYSESTFETKSLQFPCSGRELYDWAENIESRVYKALDSFLPIEQIQPEGHNELFAFTMMNKASIKVNGIEQKNRILFMFDDTHKLSSRQREFLIKYIIEKRHNFSIWISERLEALSSEDNLRSFKERDYNEINLETIWQNKESKFKTIVSNIANRRAFISTEDVPVFDQNLSEGLNESTFKENFQTGFKKIYDRLLILKKHSIKFNQWIEYLDKGDLSPLEKIAKARATEILANKNLSQPQLMIEMELTTNELNSSINSVIENAAEYFIAQEAKLPYYYGFDRVLQISSYNIDQFLQFASELYEGMLSNRVAKKSSILSADEQDRIIRRIVNEKWNELNRLIPYSAQVKKFLQRFHDFAYKETNRPTIPYAPGVTGFALKEPRELKLIETEFWLDDKLYESFRNVLSTCLSFNLLEKRQVSQGKKGGDPITVFYLNRWLCVKFNLPFGYGGWRTLRPSETIKWIQ